MSQYRKAIKLLVLLLVLFGVTVFPYLPIWVFVTELVFLGIALYVAYCRGRADQQDWEDDNLPTTITPTPPPDPPFVDERRYITVGINNHCFMGPFFLGELTNTQLEVATNKCVNNQGTTVSDDTAYIVGRFVPVTFDQHTKAEKSQEEFCREHQFWPIVWPNVKA